MPANYFYGPQAEQFAFYRIPKALFTDPAYRGISTDAKVLYGLLLDRMSLSARNDWLDEQGRVYIVFTVEEIMESLACGNKKAVGLLRELETEAGLIERRRQGLGKPNLIYVKNFIEGNFLTCQKDTSVGVKNTTQDVSKGHSNKTDKNNTDLSETDPFFSGEAAETECEGNDPRARYQEYFLRQFNFDALVASHPDDEDMLREMMELLVDTVCSQRKLIRIAGDDNLLAALYNAPLTMSNYYTARVQHDLKTE